jgi:hypothetical protein
MFRCRGVCQLGGGEVNLTGGETVRERRDAEADAETPRR